MRYSKIRSLDISNGENIGVSLFVQGCHFHCHNCFNSETWDFNGGKEWTDEVEEKFFDLLKNKPHIKRVSFLGGEPLADENIIDVYEIVRKIRFRCPDKKIWIYTGYDFEEMMTIESNPLRRCIFLMCDFLVDGRYIDELKDMSLKFRGSKNQRIIDMKETIKQNKIIELYSNEE